MNTKQLPVPSHFNKNKIGEVWRIPYQDRFKEARAWAKQHQITPSGMDEKRVNFRYRDHRDHFVKTLAITSEHFMSRVLWHVPVKGQHSVRYYGLYTAAAIDNRHRAILAHFFNPPIRALIRHGGGVAIVCISTWTVEDRFPALEVKQSANAILGPLQHQEITLHQEDPRDYAIYIEAQVRSVFEDMLIATGLVVVVVLFFLRNARSTFIALLAIPSSVIGFSITKLPW